MKKYGSDRPPRVGESTGGLGIALLLGYVARHSLEPVAWTHSFIRAVFLVPKTLLVCSCIRQFSEVAFFLFLWYFKVTSTYLQVRGQNFDFTYPRLRRVRFWERMVWCVILCSWWYKGKVGSSERWGQFWGFTYPRGGWRNEWMREWGKGEVGTRIF